MTDAITLAANTTKPTFRPATGMQFRQRIHNRKEMKTTENAQSAQIDVKHAKQVCLSVEGRPSLNMIHIHAFCSCDLDLVPIWPITLIIRT